MDNVADMSKYKQGRFMAGTYRKIYPPSRLLVDGPDYAFVLAWNFVDEIMTQQRRFRDAGRKFIIPIPEPQVV